MAAPKLASRNVPRVSPQAITAGFRADMNKVVKLYQDLIDRLPDEAIVTGPQLAKIEKISKQIETISHVCERLQNLKYAIERAIIAHETIVQSGLPIGKIASMLKLAKDLEKLSSKAEEET